LTGIKNDAAIKKEMKAMAKGFRICLIVFAGIVSSCSQSGKQDTSKTDAGEKPDGRVLFSQNCASCHTIKTAIIGPALEGVESRWQNKQLLYNYIKNSQEVIKDDEYARSLFMKYNKSIMPPFPQLQDADITAILGYINAESGNSN
jgi:mono/diheme cytochrome c family protein